MGNVIYTFFTTYIWSFFTTNNNNTNEKKSLNNKNMWGQFVIIDNDTYTNYKIT